MNRNLVFDPDYSVSDILWSQPKAVLVRARSAKRLCAVILKIARDGGDPAAKGAWEREYELLKFLAQDGADAPLGLESWNGLPVLVLPDTGALPLSRHDPKAFAEPVRFLPAALEICAALEKLHVSGLIHQFLTPDNILVNGANLKAGLMGLGQASQFFRKARGAFDRRIREGGLQYVAPEQTGMINRLMDSRTDVYALGCIFFAMLAGRAACESENASDIMAFHLAGRASLESANPEVSPAIAAVVEKCLQKEPDERYQTVSGLSADLQTCLLRARKGGKIALFTPGRHDVSPNLRPPGKLVGRNDQIRCLFKAVLRVAEGGYGSVFVSGLPGVGKTALVSEIFPLVAEKKMTLLSGRFEPVVENRPYAAICQAVSAWAMSLKWEDEERKRDWTERLGRALGELGRVIIDLAPESAFLFDTAEPLPDFPPREAQGRFFLALSRFFSAFAEEEGLVLFLDDLQWADQSTLSFIAQAAAGSISGRFLLIGAFRENELAQKSPLRDTLTAISGQGEAGMVLNIAPLRIEETRALVEELCGGVPPSGDELVKRVFSGTSGNPFYVREILHAFVEDGCLFFDRRRKRFSFNAEKAGERVAARDQRAILRDQIFSLSERCREMLCVAAAVGNVFSPGTVARILGEPPGQVSFYLAEAAARELIRPVSGRTGEHWLNFSHDHVREEAYSLLPEDRAAVLHLALSRQEHPGADPAEAAFFAADHVNLARNLISGEKDRMDAALKNLAAGRLAREAAAFGPAWRYLSAAVSFLPENAWKRRYKTTLAVYTAAAEAAYLAADKDVAARLSGVIMKQARSKMDQVEALRVAFIALLAKNRLSEALSPGLSALRLLGVRAPTNPGRIHVLYYFLMARLSLPRSKWDGLLGRPDKVPASKELAMSIYNDIALCAYSLNPNLTAAAILHQVCLIARGGLCPQAGAVMACYGFLLDQAGKVDDAYEAGLLAERLQKRWPGHRSEATTLCLVNSMIRPWKEHMRESLSGLDKAYESGIRAGNFEWGTMAAWVKCYILFFLGESLPDVDRQARKVLDEFKAMGQDKGMLYLKMDHFCILALMGASESELYEGREAYGDPEAERLLIKDNDEIALSILYTNKVIIDYYFGRYESAAANGIKMDRYINGAASSQAHPMIEIFDCLSMLALPDPFADKKRLEKKIEKLSGWAKHCPANNRHKRDLVNAEMARVSGRPDEAARLYAAAIEGAKEFGFLNFEALGLELFAKFRLSNDEIPEGMELMGKARSAYAAWGATAKVKSLDEKFGMVFLRPCGKLAEAPARQERPALASLADAAGVLADMEAKLLASAPEDRAGLFLKLLCKLAGASAGFIFVKGQRVLAVRAVWGEGAGDCEDAAASITGDELARFFARKAVSLSDWVLAPDLSKADLPQKYRRAGSSAARSILCGPVEMEWKKGAIYLENRFLKDAFDPARVNLVKKAARMFSGLEEPLGRFNRR